MHLNFIQLQETKCFRIDVLAMAMAVGFLFYHFLGASSEPVDIQGLALSKLMPTFETLDDDWTERKIIYYVYPLSQPVSYIFPDQPDPEAFKAFLIRRMQSLDCESLIKAYYGKGDTAINSGGHHLSIYRWSRADSLLEEWQNILAKAPLNQEELPDFGDAVCWAHHGLFQALAFRRGLYLVKIECGRNETVFGLLNLAERVDDSLKKGIKKQSPQAVIED